MSNGPARRVFRWVLYTGLVVVIGLIVYRHRFSPLPVIGHTVALGEVTGEVMGTGTLEARIQTVLSSKISGRIKEIRVDQGDRVEIGETLVRLDDEDLTQQVKIARSALLAGKASVDRHTANVAAAEVVMKQALRDHERNQELFSKKVISASEVEKTQKALSLAQASVASAKAALVESQKNLILAQNTLNYQEARLSDTTIKSHFEGLIVRRDRDPGDVVVPGSPILLLISTEQMWASAWVDESEMSKVGPGQRVRVIFRSEQDKVYPGHVVRLGLESDRETREFVVDVEVEKLPLQWSVGQRVEVFIETEHKKDVIAVPSEFIARNGQLVGVYVEDEGTATWRSVRLGLQGRAGVEILQGLRIGETAIRVPGSNKLADGRRVKVVEPK